MIKVEKKTRQSAENKQTFHLMEKIELRGNEKLVKTLKMNKLWICLEKNEIEEKTRHNAENKQTLVFFLIYFLNDCLYSFYILDRFPYSG